MTITVTSQKPATLNPVHTIPVHGDYDPLGALDRSLIQPLLQPIRPGQSARVVDDQRGDITAEMPDTIAACLGEDLDASLEKSVKGFLGQTMTHFDPGTLLPVQELFAAQAGTKHQLPDPRPGVLYTAREDVIPSAKALLAGSGSPEQFFASLAFTYHPKALGFWFTDATAFEEFTAWVTQQAQMMSAQLPQGTQKMLQQLVKMDLTSLTEALLLRRNELESNEEYSFARVLVHMLMLYTQQQSGTSPSTGTLPFTVSELFCPQAVILVNVEAHARATPAIVNNEWHMIEQSLAAPVKILSTKQISRLTALPRAAAKASALAAASSGADPDDGRSAQIVFRKQPPTKIDLSKDVTRQLRRMSKVNRSQNVLRTSRPTFLRASRRDPNDINRPGRITSTQYMPDLHLYVDTSGSISEENFQEAVMMLVRTAKKLDVNIYFNSFSHFMSGPALLKTKNKSAKQIWKEFRRIPKVTGGTEYEQIWRYIQASPARRRQFSLMITDFEWSPPSTRVDHPKNLYYAPCSQMNWPLITRAANDYVDAMRHIEPDIHRRLLGMTA